MTFYDWGMSEYYNSNIILTVELGKTFRESCELYGNTPTICFSNAGITYTPNIYLNSVIQPISYILNTGALD